MVLAIQFLVGPAWPTIGYNIPFVLSVRLVFSLALDRRLVASLPNR